ncbi:chromosome segregation protein [mine drainage metagenome]|uniref:Chromosome segregation protein n=1 Tax=mine drainage metagenome TaxID=410659 RepID=A0A1J5TIH7_9ZZZZ
MIEELWQVLSKFTPEAHQAALSKCAELELNQDAGIVSLNESYNNLGWCANTLRDAIEKKKLIQLPITIQGELLEIAKAISTNHDALIEGADVVETLTESIEKLFTAIWRYGLNHLTDELLGFQTKLNQLKEIEQSVITTKAKLEEGVSVKDALDLILADSKQQNDELHTHVENADTAVIATKENLSKVQEANEKAAESLQAILEQQTKSTELLTDTEGNQQEVDTHEKAIRALVSEFTNLNTELVASKKKQTELFAEFQAYRDKIDGLLGDANRTGMAASFTNRRFWLLAPLSGWLLIFGISIAGLLYMGITFIAPLLDAKATVPWEQLPMRLALTAPFIWLGWFSARQHGFTSRLREDYAYKEASAKSFEGYKREAKEVDPEMLKKLLEQAIKNLGDNPIRIYDGKNNHPSPTHELFDSLMKDDKAVGRFKEFFSIFKS